jgi:hypothetical protein
MTIIVVQSIVKWRHTSEIMLTDQHNLLCNLPCEMNGNDRSTVKQLIVVCCVFVFVRLRDLRWTDAVRGVFPPCPMIGQWKLSGGTYLCDVGELESDVGLERHNYLGNWHGCQAWRGICQRLYNGYQSKASCLEGMYI